MKILYLLLFVSFTAYSESIQLMPISSGGNSDVLSTGQSNAVVSIINAVAPTNSGITAAVAATQIASTNNAIIQPNINSASNSVVITGQASVNTASNSVVGTGQTSVNTASNSVVGTMQTSINTSSNLVYVSANAAINTSSNSIVTNLPPRASYVAMTNTTTGVIGNVLMTSGHVDTNGSPAGIWTNLQPFNMEYHIATNAFTNWIIGYYTFTNADGRVCSIPVGTNQ
jgi:hypothetical protein